MAEQAQPRGYLLRRMPEWCPDCGGRLFASGCWQMTCRGCETTFVVRALMPWRAAELESLAPNEWDGE
jgi:hypothetical protein